MASAPGMRQSSLPVSASKASRPHAPCEVKSGRTTTPSATVGAPPKSRLKVSLPYRRSLRATFLAASIAKWRRPMLDCQTSLPVSASRQYTRPVEPTA